MPRYYVAEYTFLVPIAYGKMQMRVRCPTCEFAHADIACGGESLCYGCGQTLTVKGAELFVYVMPGGSVRDEDRQSSDKPDYPTFWYDERP